MLRSIGYLSYETLTVIGKQNRGNKCKGLAFSFDPGASGYRERKESTKGSCAPDPKLSLCISQHY